MKGNVVAQHVVHIPAKFKIVDDIDVVFKVVNAIGALIQGRNVLAVCIESPTFASSSLRSKQLNMLFGSIITSLGLPYFVGNPTSIKKFATGKGSHDKSEKKTVMIEAWQESNPISYDKAFSYLSINFTKSVVTRAIGDLADSYWLAMYGLHQLQNLFSDIGEIPRTKENVDSAIINVNPEVLVTDIHMDMTNDT